MSATREIVYVERDTVTAGGRTVRTERAIHGILSDDGTFRPLAFREKRFPMGKTACADALGRPGPENKSEAA